MFGVSEVHVRVLKQVAAVHNGDSFDAEEALDQHGNAGRAPANKSSDATEQLVSDLLDRFVKPVPDPSGKKARLQFTRSDVNSVPELYRQLVQATGCIFR